MAGLINNARGVTGGDHLSPAKVQAQMAVPPDMQQQFERIVVAGQKVMFDPSTHKLMLDAINKPGALPQKLGEGVAGLVGLLMQQANNSLKPELLIPAAIVLLAHAVDYLKQSGQDVSDEDYGQAMGVMIHAILESAKVDSNKVISAIDSHGKSGNQVKPLVQPDAPPTQQPAMTGAPTEQEP